MSIRNKVTKGSQKEIITNSIEAMMLEAKNQGWFDKDGYKFIPELMNIYNEASSYFTNLIFEQESKMHETFVFHTCRYLFAKGVEGVILWGAAPTGKISVYFHPKHLVGEVETEVPKHLHQEVLRTIDVGESLFKAHQKYVIDIMKNSKYCDFNEEIKKTIEWIPRLGIHYGLHKNYDTLR